MKKNNNKLFLKFVLYNKVSINKNDVLKYFNF